MIFQYGNNVVFNIHKKKKIDIRINLKSIFQTKYGAQTHLHWMVLWATLNNLITF